jgi:hypothetical protein
MSPLQPLTMSIKFSATVRVSRNAANEFDYNQSNYIYTFREAPDYIRFAQTLVMHDELLSYRRSNSTVNKYQQLRNVQKSLNNKGKFCLKS